MEAAQILRDALEGCDEALSALVRTYHERVYSFARRLRGETLGEDAPVEEDSGSPADLLARWELIHALHRAIVALPPHSRQVLLLHEIEALPSAEVAGLLRLSEAETLRRLRCARDETLVELARNARH